MSVEKQSGRLPEVEPFAVPAVRRRCRDPKRRGLGRRRTPAERLQAHDRTSARPCPRYLGTGRTTVDVGLDEDLVSSLCLGGMLDDDFDDGDAWTAQELDDARMVFHAIRSEEDRWDAAS